MRNPIETIEYKGQLIKVYSDDNATSPDEYGDDSIFLVHYHRDCWIEGAKRKGGDGKFYPIITEKILGYIFTGNEDDYDKDGAQEILKEYWVFPVEAYIHSGVSLTLTSFAGMLPQGHYEFDTSRVGAVLCSKKEWRLQKSAYKAAQSTVETWNDYLCGNVYGFMAETPDGEDIDSCWGFYGAYNKSGMLDDAKGNIDYYLEQQRKEHIAHVKTLIKHNVPLLARVG